MARDMGMDTLELNKYAETHPEIDRKIDQITIDLAASKDRLVLDFADGLAFCAELIQDLS